MLAWLIPHFCHNETPDPAGPVRGKDGTWIQFCHDCKYSQLHASVGGLENDGTKHCYACGKRSLITGFRQADIDRMVVSFKVGSTPRYPYYMHLLTEEERMKCVTQCGKKRREEIKRLYGR